MAWFSIAAGRSVDCTTIARLKGLHTGATDDESSENSRRGVDGAEAITPRRQGDDFGDDDDTPGEDSTRCHWLTLGSWRRAASNDHYLVRPDSGLRRWRPVKLICLLAVQRETLSDAATPSTIRQPRLPRTNCLRSVPRERREILKCLSPSWLTKTGFISALHSYWQWMRASPLRF
jgi:hypothetical protein